MDIQKKKTIDMLTPDSVSILTQNYIEFNGVQNQVGQNHRCSYINSNTGRTFLQENESEEVVNAVFAIWGDTPTIEEPEEAEADAE